MKSRRLLTLVCAVPLVLLYNLIASAQISFNTRADYPTQKNPYAIIAADFNRDGKLDLAITNYLSSSVSILLGRGNGTFQPKRDFETGGYPQAIAVEDFNRDGKLDLVVDGSGGYILLGNGDGTFAPAVPYAQFTTSICVKAGDFNGDGFPDLVTSYYGPQILLGKGDGTFLPAVDLNIGGYHPSVVIGDFNGDLIADLAVTDSTNDTGTVAILLGNGDGSFGSRSDFPVAGAGGTCIIKSDFNGDGKLDLAVANYRAGSVSVLIGNGDGTFQTKQDHETGMFPWALTSADFDGDGTSDLAVTGLSGEAGQGGWLSIFPGNCEGTFRGKITFQVYDLAHHDLVAGRFNGDKKFDLAIPNFSYDPSTGNTVSVLLNTTKPSKK